MNVQRAERQEMLSNDANIRTWLFGFSLSSMLFRLSVSLLICAPAAAADANSFLQKLSPIEAPQRVENYSPGSNTAIAIIFPAVDKAQIVIIERSSADDYKIVAHSKLFGYYHSNYGATEIGEFSSRHSDQFSVSLIYHETCGAEIDTHRFAFRHRRWMVVGFDMTDDKCGDEGIGIELDKGRSLNFLTGQGIVTRFRNDKPWKRSPAVVQLKAFPIEDFPLGDEIYSNLE